VEHFLDIFVFIDNLVVKWHENWKWNWENQCQTTVGKI